MYLFVGPHWGGFGETSSGDIFLNPHHYMNLTPVDTSGAFQRPSDATAVATDTLRLTYHEYFHRFHNTWEREVPGTADFLRPKYVSEAMTSANDKHTCAVEFPGAVDDAERNCINAGKLGLEYVAGTASRPQSDLLTSPYSSSLFWRYLYEQFSWPVGLAPHPTGTDSAFQRPLAETRLYDRPSDEGMDFIGLLFQQWGRSTATNVFDATGEALEAHLGRSFEEVLFDYHTALYLKDYTETDARWRFTWTHADGFSAGDPAAGAGDRALSSAKPFVVPYDINGEVCGPDPNGGRDICDSLPRAERTLDSWVQDPATGNAVRDLMARDEQRASASPITIGKYGATAISVSPDPAWQGRDMQVFAAMQDGHSVRFRLFRVHEDAASGALEPEPVCGQAPDWECPVTSEADTRQRVVNELVGIDSDVVEVLLIASTQGSSRFEYSVGDPALRVSLVEPTTSRPSFVGHPDALRRSFLIALRITDEQNRPVALTDADKDDLFITVDGCASDSDCLLPEEQYTVLPLTGGDVLVVATLPKSYYPDAPPSGMFGLQVAYRDSDPVFQADALEYGIDRSLATVLVLDRSGSMARFEGVKLAALKIVAKGLAQALVPASGHASLSQAALITFNEDADTPLPLGMMSVTQKTDYENAIDDLGAGGGTSIGDALLEAQSVLAEAYDTADTRPTDQMILLVSDGINESLSSPEEYFEEHADDTPAGDGRGGDWYSESPLNYHQRLYEGLPVPHIAAIGIGQDADLETLDRITALSGTGPLWVQGPEDFGVGLDEMTGDLGDSGLEGYNRSLGFDRIHYFPITGPSEEPPEIVIARAVTGGAATAIPSTASFEVESGARELRVTVMSADTASGTLLSPEGDIVDPTAESGDGKSRAYRLLDPAPGPWNFYSHASEGIRPTVFVEAAVRAPFQLFSVADVENIDPANAEPLIGSDVFLRVVPHELGPVLGCTVSAQVQMPGRGFQALVLLDDGRSHDGAPEDGVYGALYRRTGVAGAYRVRIWADCVSPTSGEAIHREGRTGFLMRGPSAEQDSDGDGLPNAWEQDCLDPNDPADAALDQDGDGLSTISELRFFGTAPCRADTDGGGESDSSEIDNSRDPRDPRDDQLSVPVPEVTPGDEIVYILPGIKLGGLTLIVEWAPSPTGPWAEVPDAWSPGQPFAIHAPVTNGETYCYRLRAWVGKTSTTWSEPICVVPGSDSIRPRVEILEGPDACGRDYVQPRLRFEDTDYGGDSGAPLVDLGTKASGVTEMRWWPGPGEPPADLQWQAANEAPLLTVPTDGSTVISLEVRDAAGNVSERVLLPLSCPAGPCARVPREVACCSTVANCPGLLDFALYADGRLDIEDAVVVVTDDGSAAAVANAGTGDLVIGVEAETGMLWAEARVFLRDRSVVHGDVTTSGVVDTQNLFEVEGAITEESTMVALPSLTGFTIPFPETNRGDRLVQDGASLDPGAFGAVHLMPGANLNLRAGTYFMESLFLEPGTTVHLDTAAGPIFLYVRSGFTYRGVFIDSQGEHDNLLVGYFGTDVAWIEAPFSGTLVAPRARAEFKSLNGVGSHQGAVFAKEIRLNPQTPFVHHPFGAPWTGGLANVVTLPDSEPGAPTCTDGAANGEETGVDCGGSVCPACGLGMPCVVDSDCTSGACSSGVCAAPALAVSATLTLTSNWGTGYCANVEVRNHDTVATSSWTVVLDAHESVIVNLWNGDATQDGSTYAVENMSYNGQVGPGATTAFGFCANKLGSAYSPEVVSASGG